MHRVWIFVYYTKNSRASRTRRASGRQPDVRGAFGSSAPCRCAETDQRCAEWHSGSARIQDSRRTTPAFFDENRPKNHASGQDCECGTALAFRAIPGALGPLGNDWRTREEGRAMTTLTKSVTAAALAGLLAVGVTSDA